MADPRIPLKNPLLAAILAFLIPGAGHLYQGRRFKAAVYSVCILGTFFYGMHMAEWKAVYRSADPVKRNLGYYAQAATGLPALYAVVQTMRSKDAENGSQDFLSSSLSSPFTGLLFDEKLPGSHSRITGRLELEPIRDGQGNAVVGTFRGTFEDGEVAEFSLGERKFFLGPKIGGNSNRKLDCSVVRQQDDGIQTAVGHIEGSIPRNFLDWFQAPLNDDDRNDLNGRLGKWYDLALVYTWIAGLLNILAIWDAMEGPAYGYGDEQEEDEDDTDDKKEQPKEKGEKKLEPVKS